MLEADRITIMHVSFLPCKCHATEDSGQYGGANGRNADGGKQPFRRAMWWIRLPRFQTPGDGRLIGCLMEKVKDDEF